jgi:hypothetical protein
MVIETAEGEAVGFLLHPPAVWGPMMYISGYELKPGVSWLAVTPSVIRYAVEVGQQYAAEKGDLELQGYHFNLGAEHPVYQVMSERMPRCSNPYAWYVRIPDLADFLMHIGPVLEERLAKSPLVGHTGKLRLSFHRSGVQMVFEKGCLTAVENYRPEGDRDGDALFPDLTFLRVLMGHTAFEDVEKFFADCYACNDHGRALVPVLFPRQASNVWPVA